MNRSTQKAIDFITDNLKNAVWKDGDRLPTAGVLAKSIHVRVAAMVEALQTLQSRGMVFIAGQNGIFAGNRVPHGGIDNSLYGKKWQKLKLRIESEMIDHESGATYRTSVKELAQRHNASLFLCRQAVNALVEEKRLQIAGRYYTGIDRHAGKPQASILFISQGFHFPQAPVAPGTPSDHISLFNQRIYDFLVAASLSCGKNQVKFSKLGIDLTNRRSSELLRTIIAQGDHIGYVLYLPGGLSPDQLLNLTLPFAATRKPVVFVLDSGELVLPASFTDRHFVKFLYSSDKKAGNLVGRFLIEKDHAPHQVAYIANNYSKSLWSQMRYTGICDAFSEKPGRGKPILYDNAATAGHLPPSRSRIDNDIRIMESCLKKISDDSEMMKVRFEVEMNAGNALFENSYQYLSCVPLFKRIADENSCKVWVFENDHLAFAAYFFFHKFWHYRPVPLVGFDNSSLARSWLFTTYDFDYGSMARKAVAYVLNPGHPGFGRSRAIECEGHVLEW